MTVYLPRTQWISRPASGAALGGAKLRGVAVHWPGTATARFGVESQATVAAHIQHYWEYHTQVKRWRDLGYNVVGDQAGRVWEGRTTAWRGNMIGAHCASVTNRDANEEYVGYLFMLGNSEQPTDAMIDAFRHWYHTRFLPGWPGRDDVREHNAVPGAQTECAGPYVRRLLAAGTLTQPPDTAEEDEMPTAQEIADAVWRRRLRHAGAETTTTAGTHLTYGRKAATEARTYARRAEAKADAILTAVQAIPGVDVAALAQQVAAEVNRIDEEALAEAAADELAERLTD